MTNTEVVKSMYQLFSEGKTQDIRTIFSEDLKWNMMSGFPNGGIYTGIEAVFENVFGYFQEHWEEWNAISEQFHETSTGVFVTGYYTGIFKGTGKFVKAKFASFYKVADHKITEYYQWTDTALIAAAMIN